VIDGGLNTMQGGSCNGRHASARLLAVSRTLAPLAKLLTKCMPVPRRSRCIIEPLDHEKGVGSAAPPIFKGYVPAGREMREMDRGPAFDLFQYLGIGCWREPARPTW
jgi:hypothetical protein